jgi:hypothetical protein
MLTVPNMSSGLPTPQAGVDGPWRHDKLLVLLSDVPLPPRCIKCGVDVAAADVPVRLVWSPHARPGGRSLASKATFLATARRVTVRVGLCIACRGRRRRVLGAWIAVMLFGAIAFGTVIFLSETGRVYSANPWAAGVAMAGCFLAFAPLWLIALALPLVKPVEIDDDCVVACGAGATYLDQLPAFAR